MSEWAEILWGFTKLWIKEMLKISDFYLDKKKVLFLKNISSIACTMDRFFFSQQMSPWRSNFHNLRLWTHYWHSFRWRQLGFVSTFTGYSTSSLVSIVLWSLTLVVQKTPSPRIMQFQLILVMYMRKLGIFELVVSLEQSHLCKLQVNTIFSSNQNSKM